jgi:hypothetical protein
MNAPLSPVAAAAVGYMTNCGWLGGPLEKDYRCAAAVLRAAADQVVPENLFGPAENVAAAQREITRLKLLAIAAELEALPND